MNTPALPRKLRIDLVSDVVCPWCVIGYRQLERALSTLEGEVEAEIHWHPFQLNPGLAAEGQDLREHLAGKYGTTEAQSAAVRDRLTNLGAELGFEFRFAPDKRIYNTFDAHRLVAWARDQSPQTAHRLELVLFDSYFTLGEDVSDAKVLGEVAVRAGLDAEGAAHLLTSDSKTEEVKTEEALWKSRGISGVPAFILGEKYLVSGAQGEEALAEALRQAAREGAEG